MLFSIPIIIVSFVSLTFSLIYGIVQTNQPTSTSRTFVKTIPITALALISYLAGGPTLLTVALALGAIGDLCLSRDGEAAFMMGLGSFLFGHLCFCLLFVQFGDGLSTLTMQTWRLLACMGLLIFAIFITRKLYPHLGKLTVPVLFYILTILVMGVTTLTLPATHPLQLAILGSILFIASDTILSLELFVLEKSDAVRRYTAPTLWFLYWGGQSFITFALLVGTTQ